jgi:hypothetical protein
MKQSKEALKVTEVNEAVIDENKTVEPEILPERQAYLDFKKEYEKKVYLIPQGAGTLKALKLFMEERVEWTGAQFMGVVRVVEEIDKEINTKKRKKFLSGICIEAIAYFVQNYKAVGYEWARQFGDTIFKPTDELMRKLKEDRQKLMDLEREAAAAEQGIKVEGDVEAITETENNTESNEKDTE